MNSAIISECGKFRFRLERNLNPLVDHDYKSTVAWIMLNPSTADADKDDATIRKISGFSRKWGFDRLIVANLSPLRSTDPSALLSQELNLEAEKRNLQEMAHVIGDSYLIVCAWGSHPYVEQKKVLTDSLKKLYRCGYLKLSKSGHPYHPLYLPGDLRPVDWEFGQSLL